MGTSAFRLGSSDAATNTMEIITQAGHGFSAGDVVRPTSSTGVFALAQANTSSNAEGIGVISEASAHTFTIVYSGEIQSNGLTGRSSGDVLFLSQTAAGKLTPDPPTLPGEVIKCVVVMTEDNDTGLVVNYVGSVIGGESTVSVEGLQPVGTIVPYGGNSGSVPAGWFMCDGSTYAGCTYPDLYGVIETSFGGSGSTGTNDWFNVPDMQGRFALGGGTGSGLTIRTLGTSGGLEVATDPTPGIDGEFDVLGTLVGQTAGVSVIPPFVVTNYLIRHEKNSRASISGLLASDLADTGISGASAGELLQYEGNGNTGKWENVSVSDVLNAPGALAAPPLSVGVTAGYPYRILDFVYGSTTPASAIDDQVDYRYTGLRIITSGHNAEDKIWLQGNLILYMDVTDAGNDESRLFDFGIYTGTGANELTAGAAIAEHGVTQYNITGLGANLSNPGDPDGVTLSFPISFIHKIGTAGDVNYDLAVRANSLGGGGVTATISDLSTYYAMNLYG